MTPYYDTGSYTRKITTASSDAQSWFDHGLTWAYGFNYEESARCFRRAAAADPDCPMAHWGIAYAAGPYYNRPWNGIDPIGLPTVLAETHTAAETAMGLRDRASPVECALIEAISARHPANEPPTDFMTWTNAYADAMRVAYQAHPDDADVCTLFSDAVMSRTPWKLWDLRTGETQSRRFDPGGARGARNRHSPQRESRRDTARRSAALLHPSHGNVADPGSGTARG